MAQVFQDCCRSAFRRAGTPGMLGLWARTMLDYVLTLIEEHMQRGMDMSRASFLNWSGWALLSGPLMIFLGFLASTRPEYSPYNARSLPIDRFLNGSVYVLLAVGLVLAAVGVFGVLVRFGARAGVFGRGSLLLSGMGGCVSAAGAVGTVFKDSEIWWTSMFIGLVGLLLGVGLFGIVCVQRRLLGGWSGVPLATALWMPAAVAFERIYPLAPGRLPEMPPALGAAAMVAGLAGLALLGYRVLRTAFAERRGMPAG